MVEDGTAVGARAAYRKTRPSSGFGMPPRSRPCWPPHRPTEPSGKRVLQAPRWSARHISRVGAPLSANVT